MKRAAFILVVFALTLMNATAKRAAPADVAPVTNGGITYTAPHDAMGCVIATDAKTGTKLWEKKIYLIKYDSELERDVQDCFISKLEIKDGNLRVTNERGGEFELDPKTQEITVHTGEAVIDRTAPKTK